MTVKDENGMTLSAALWRASVNTDDETLADFYDWVALRYDSREYAEVRDDCEGKISPKFFAVCERSRRLMPIAKWLLWDTKSDLKTLDLGSGAGHMGLIATFFGHSAIGLDSSHQYDGLREFWQQPATMHNIEASEPLPPIGKFHSITSILTNYGRAWVAAEWDEFLDCIIADHLEPGGEFVLHFPGKQNLAYREHLRARASRLAEGGRYMFFASNTGGMGDETAAE